jgi:hypothetical protein
MRGGPAGGDWALLEPSRAEADADWLAVDAVEVPPPMDDCRSAEERVPDAVDGGKDGDGQGPNPRTATATAPDPGSGGRDPLDVDKADDEPDTKLEETADPLDPTEAVERKPEEETMAAGPGLIGTRDTVEWSRCECGCR